MTDPRTPAEPSDTPLHRATDIEFFVATVSRDGTQIGIDHPTEADWFEVRRAHEALRDRLNDRLGGQSACPVRPATDADRLVEALNDAEEALIHLDEGALGFVEVPTGEEDGCYIYPLRDELLNKIRAALANTKDNSND